MPDASTLAAYFAVILGFAVTPGPNMIYLISRSISQGSRAGILSLGGSAMGFLVYMVCAALGITAVLMAVPFAFDALRIVGAGYLLFLAWQAVKPGGHSPFEVVEMPASGRGKVFLMGMMTTLLNPKAALVYLALLPQFVVPGHGSVLAQTLVLGSMHIALNLAFGVVIANAAGALAKALSTRPRLMKLQKWTMGSLLATFSVKLVAVG